MRGPLVLMLHGFPQFWWAWRHQLVALGDAGWHAVAMDLRGCGSSDKPPQGYDAVTGARDVAAVVRALGASRAVVVGQGWGGLLAWALPALAPRTVRAVAVLAAPHPLELRPAALSRRAWRSGRAASAWGRAPRPESEARTRRFVARALSGDAPGPWPGAEDVERYGQALRVTRAGHAAREYRRWLVEWMTGLRGRALAQALHRPVDVPVLQIHGSRDRVTPPSWARASARHTGGPYRWHEVAGAGHFLAEQAPDEVSRTLGDWLGRL